MKVAVFGCLHGQLNDMFNAVEQYEKQNNCNIEIIIVCGDCQTIRHLDDLSCLAVPNKYKRLGDFHEYYSGHKKIPKLTIFIGGNHEASNYLMTLPYGGWVCDNFYYLGFAGVVNYKWLRIGGISGIYNFRNCNLGRFERMPLDDNSIRSIYHTRRLDVFRLQLLSQNISKDNQIDLFLSHDWPARVYDHGNLQQLLRFKPQFKADVNSREGLGSPLTQPLISQLKPRRWFAAHLHCRFYAKVQHDPSNDEHCTEFLSLNKIEKGRRFVEYLDLDTPCQKSNQKQEDLSNKNNETEIPKSGDLAQDDNELYYDPEWLTVLRKTISLEINSTNNVPCPNINDGSAQSYFPTNEDIQETIDMMNNTGGLKIQRNFSMTEPVIYDRQNGDPPSIDKNRTKYFPNPQHVGLCSRLKIDDQLAINQVHSSSTTNDDTNEGSYNHKQDYDRRQDQYTPNRNRGTASNRYMGRNQRHGPHMRSGQSYRNNDFEGSTGSGHVHPNKKRAFELDEDGCLPYYVDKKGDS